MLKNSKFYFVKYVLLKCRYIENLAIKYLILCIDINTTLFLIYNRIYYVGVLEKKIRGLV